LLPLFTDLLRDFITRRLIVPRERVFLGPPDRTFVGGLPSPGVSVNVYLADLRENRQLRTNERLRTPLANGAVREDPYPAWVDAHYLISAWDTAKVPNVATLSEQRVLSAVSAALLGGDPLTPADVYGMPADPEVPALLIAFGFPNLSALLSFLDTQIAPWPREFRVPGLPYQVLPPEGFPKYSEFWTTMGQGSVWRAVVWLVASVPLQLAQGLEFPAVTTMTTVTGQTEDALRGQLIPGTGHPWHQIGGRVFRPDPPGPLAPAVGARVLLQLPGDDAAVPPRPAVSVQETRTDDQGRYQFMFAGLPPADGLAPFTTPYQVVVRYPGLQADPQPVDLNPRSPLAHDIVLGPVP
jgi:hypothetical protein